MRCVIAGGGTGGHLFPGMAIAEAFLQKEKGNEVLFIGTERGIEKRVLAERNFPLRTIKAAPLLGRSFLEKLGAIRTLPGAILEALAILKEFKPDLVLGVGGYASGPTLVSAFLLGMKRAIHEQNIVPGTTNRMLKSLSHRIFVSFEETKRYFPGEKTLVTGNPVRSDIFSCKEKEGSKEEGKGRFTVLVFGGSSGARRINQAMVEALGALAPVKDSLRFFHQSGRDDFESLTKSYEEKGFEARVSPFFDEMAKLYQRADLVICRAGASTLAELAVCGKAAILVPYPYAAHQHQLTNAKKLVDLHAARMILNDELDGASLARAVLDLYAHPEICAAMGERIGRLGRPKAAEEIVHHCYALVHG